MADVIPQWAKERAASLINDAVVPAAKVWRAEHFGPTNSIACVLARYIAEHEEPPVDPLVAVLDEVLSGFETREHAERYATLIRAKLAARGLEVRKVLQS
jgi:hypothetical protein